MQQTTKLELSDWQSQVWMDDHRYKVINCGRRAGKSVLAAAYLLFKASKNPFSQTWYIAPTYRQAEGIMWLMLKEILPQHAIKNTNNSKLSIEFTNGAWIHLKGADNPDSLRGVGLDLVIFDEAAFMDKWEEVWKVIRPTLMDSQADVWFISTPNGFNHFKDMADKQDPDWKYFHFTTYDNPHIPITEIEQAKLEMDEDSFAQEMLGEFRKMSGLIYKTFSRDTHMVEIPFHRFDSNWMYTRALDFGFSHKTALGYFAINPNGTEIYMFDGLYQSGMVMSELADVVKVKDAGRVMIQPVADSASPMQIEELSRLGVHFEPVKKGQDSVTNGINKVADLLKIRKDTGKPTLMFSDKLGWVADEFEQYRWVQNKSDGFVKDIPMKRNDDAMDMIRYMATTYSESIVTTNHIPVLSTKDDDLGF
jgi:PBSX family phage terminase large subunit